MNLEDKQLIVGGKRVIEIDWAGFLHLRDRFIYKESENGKVLKFKEISIGVDGKVVFSKLNITSENKAAIAFVKEIFDKMLSHFTGANNVNLFFKIEDGERESLEILWAIINNKVLYLHYSCLEIRRRNNIVEVVAYKLGED